MTNVKILEKKAKLQGQGHGIKWKVLIEGIHMWNMKALPPTNQKSCPRLKFWKRRSNSKVKGQKVKVIVSNERSWLKEYTCEIWKP
jgi:hypothetical protein